MNSNVFENNCSIRHLFRGGRIRNISTETTNMFLERGEGESNNFIIIRTDQWFEKLSNDLFRHRVNSRVRVQPRDSMIHSFHARVATIHPARQSHSAIPRRSIDRFQLRVSTWHCIDSPRWIEIHWTRWIRRIRARVLERETSRRGRKIFQSERI